MDDRSELFTNLTEPIVFVPDGQSLDALESLRLATYSYDAYLSKPKHKKHSIVIPSADMTAVQDRTNLLDAIIWARDLINMPPQDANPVGIVDIIQAHTWRHFNVAVFDKKALENIGCNLLLAVGAGSDFPPYMVVLTPKNPPKTEKYGFIGKGVTFDAGGMQIKPDTGMLDMKCDMSGAAGMLGVAMYLDTLDTLPVDLTVAVGLTENMTGGSAFKPLDIYRAYNGTTVEIHHTDAEGRLVLADVMSYVEKNHHVDHLITMATLT
jgi:leucyl aminopeptidase